MRTLLVLSLLSVALSAGGGEVIGPSSNAFLVAQFYHTGRTNEVLRIYYGMQKTLEQQDPDAMVVVARILIEQHEVEKAFSLLGEVARKRPTDYLPHFLRGIVHTRQGDRARATLLLRESVKRNPMHALSYLWLASATISHEERIAALRRVLVLEDRESPTAKKALSELGEDGQPAAGTGGGKVAPDKER